MSQPDDPLAALLGRVEPRLRAVVEAARESGEWEAASAALVGAARARPGPRHLDYARLLLALDRFAECRSVLDRAEGAVDDVGLRGLRAELLLEEAATRFWEPVPGRRSRRVPTSLAAIDGVADALEQARALDPRTPQAVAQIEAFQRAVDWSRREAKTGGMVGALGALCVAMITGLIASEPGQAPWMVPMLLYSASAPLLYLGGGRPQVEINARVVSGRRTFDEQFLDGLAKTAPLLAPLGLLSRMVAHGVAAPITVVTRAAAQRRWWPPVALLACLGLGVFLAATQPPVEAPPEPEPPASRPVVVFALPDGPREVELGAAHAGEDTTGEVSLSLTRRGDRVISAVFRAPAGHPAPDLSAWGDATRTRQLDGGEGPCRVTAEDFGEAGTARATRCPTQQTWEIRAR